MKNIRLPLSGGQKAIVLKAVHDPADVSHNLLAVFNLTQIKDGRQLEARLARAIAARPALLMRIGQENGIFFQQIGSISDVKIQHVNASGHDIEHLIRDAQHFGDKPFEIIGDPLLRVRIYDRGSDAPVLAIAANHVIADLASLQIICDDIIGEEDAVRSSHDLQGLREFLAQDILARRGETGKCSAKFWNSTLQDAPEQTGLPLDRPRPARRNRRSVVVRREVRSETVERVDRLARETGMTQFTIYLAAFILLLSVHDDSESIVVGTPVSLRGRSHLRNVVGYLANVLPIRVDLSPSATAEDIIRLVRVRTAEAMDHAEYPLDAILKAARVRTQANLSPLFQTLFMWNDLRAHRRGDLGERPSILHLSQRGCAFDLMPTVFMTQEVSWFSLQGDASIFDGVTLERMADDYFRILDLLCEDCTWPVRRLRSCLGPPAVLGNYAGVTTGDALADVFRNLTSEPEKIALWAGSRAFSYAELDRHARTAQEHLCRLSLAMGDVVALSFSRSVGYVAYVLACLADGIAFVPVSSHEPSDRLANMLSQAGASCLISDRGSRPDVPIEQHASVSFTSLSTSNVEAHDVVDSAAAYVLFTSGSTGSPKGVAVSRGALSKTVACLSDLVNFGPDDSMAALSAFTFDISLFELLMPLCRTGCLHLLDDETSGDPVRIAGYVAAHAVSFLQATPSMWRLLIMARIAPVRPLTALCGGEALSSALARDILPKVEALWNLYGPTEATIWASAHRVAASDQEMLLGSPIPGMAVGVFDRDGALLQQGVVGELGLAGDGLAIGYASDPGTTAERFRMLAGEDEPARWYLTGDLGMIRDGRLLFRGRRDGQVKINGHRIELGEVATAAERVDGVAEAAAVAWRDGHETRIALFFSAGESAEVEAITMRVQRALNDALPQQMRPSEVRAIGQLPKTPSGKTDRRELERIAAYSHIARRTDNVYRAPATAIELALVDIWEAVLQTDRIGLDDDFFELGGTSIQGVEIAVRAQNLDIEVSPETLLSFSTIAQIAAELDRVRSPDA